MNPSPLRHHQARSDQLPHQTKGQQHQQMRLYPPLFAFERPLYAWGAQKDDSQQVLDGFPFAIQPHEPTHIPSDFHCSCPHFAFNPLSSLLLFGHQRSGRSRPTNRTEWSSPPLQQSRSGICTEFIGASVHLVCSSYGRDVRSAFPFTLSIPPTFRVSCPHSALPRR